MMPHVSIPLRIRDEVADALAAGRPVVALESTLLAHGLPAGRNRDVADRLEATVRAQGAVPATIAVLDGAAVAGCDSDQLDRLCSGKIAKLSRRDLGPAVACGVAGATTVAGTLAVAGLAGIDVFATGGLGGVHRSTSWDVSADLATLAAVPVLVVCSGVKSILDIAATLEQLETLSVPVVGFGTDAFPGFYRRDSGHRLPWRADTARAAALCFAAHRRLGAPAGLVLANPVPPEHELATELHDAALSSGLALVVQQGLRGKEVTPAMLAHFHTTTGGASIEANVALVLANAALAARVAVELSRL
jgi:pseudouridylate synthase